LEFTATTVFPKITRITIINVLKKEPIERYRFPGWVILIVCRGVDEREPTKTIKTHDLVKTILC
jgi:hypothetical protein